MRTKGATMPFDGILIHQLVQEMKHQLVGKYIDKIHQPHKDAMILRINNRSLFISIDPSMPYFTLTKNSFENPLQPPMFCMLLRKHLQGSKCINIEQYGLDRVVNFSFECKNNIGDSSIKHLLIEIMGKHSNVIFTDHQNKILEAMKRVPIDTSSVRPVLPGLPYHRVASNKYVLPKEAEIYWSEQPDHWNNQGEYLLSKKEIVHFLEGFSSNTAEFFLQIYDQTAPAQSPEIRLTEAMKFFLQSTKGYVHYHPEGHAIDFHLYPTSSSTMFPTISEAVDDYYSRSIKELKIHQLALRTKKMVQIRMDRLESKILKLEKELHQAQEATLHKRKGEAIIASMYQLSQGMNKTSLPDYSTNPIKMLEITLDTKKTPAENAQAYFKKYRKASHAQVILREQMLQAKQDIKYLHEMFTLLDHTEERDTLDMIREELYDAGFLPKKYHQRKKKNKQAYSNYHRFFTSNGFEILVGKSGKSNDQLSLKIARKTDIWFHTKDIPSAHVVLLTEQKDVPAVDIQEAAEICVYYSKARNSSHIQVDYCLAKYVKKPKGAKPGMVIYTNYESTIATPDIKKIEGA